jgi:hypothetical protein
MPITARETIAGPRNAKIVLRRTFPFMGQPEAEGGKGKRGIAICNTSLAHLITEPVAYYQSNIQLRQAQLPCALPKFVHPLQ